VEKTDVGIPMETEESGLEQPLRKQPVSYNALEHIRKFKELIESQFYSELLKNVRKGNKFLVIPFPELSKFDPDLANELLDNPEEVIKAAELSVQQFDIYAEQEAKNVRVRFSELPTTQHQLIRNIRSSHLNKLLVIEGVVRQKSDVRPQVTASKFECPSCGNVINVLQLDTTFREPSKCGCGRKGKFLMLGNELVDAQGIVIEENPELLEGGEQPKRINVFLKDDLVSPLSEKRTSPGSRIVVNGIVKEVPIISRSGAKLTRFDLLIEANYVGSSQESFYEVEITEDDVAAIKDIAEDPRGYDKIIQSIAPSIYGYDKIKEALLLQMMGGIRKIRNDKVVSRGDMHILLVGDPGCIAGDSQIALIYKGMEQIKNLGEEHLQPIKEVVTKIRRHGKDKYYDFATLFQHYPKQPVLRLVTETGKEIICTYNQPFLTREGWKRADKLVPGEEVRVMPKIPNMVKKHAPTGFEKIEQTTGKLKDVKIPQELSPELASLYGYILGDGHVHKNGYRIACYVNDEERDLVPYLNSFWEVAFAVKPQIMTKDEEQVKTIDDGHGLLRQFVSRQKMYVIEVYSKQVASALSFLSVKQVPQQIFRSPNKVIAKFISWLFEADGCVFSTGRGRTSVQLKSVSKKLLQDVQLLLLYFGIQSRIIEDNLCIRRSRDIELFSKHIGFNSQKKKIAMESVLAEVKSKSDVQKRKSPQRYEAVVAIEPFGVQDVYDFEVPVSHMFVANGIVCHNSGKSQMLKRVAVIAPKSRYVSGKGVSGAGLTAAVVRDEFLKGWALEAGALVLASDGLCAIDEMDKMGPEDRAAMHEALEQQTVSVSKANVQATLIARTTVLAAANPKLGRFDPFDIIANQIDMPPTLINRFDLIFPIKDLPDDVRDEKLATHILGLHQNPDAQSPPLSTNMLKKFIAYARQFVHPRLSPEAVEEIKTFYLKMRMSGSEEGGVRTIPISARQLEALVRMSEASARTRLSDIVMRRDARKAIELLEYCLLQVGLDRETGKIDIDRIATGVGASQRSNIIIVKEILAELEGRVGKTIAIEDIMAEARTKGLDGDKVEEALEKLRRTGDVFEPRRGFISRL
jgi:DNA replicative helicase MCM subunit Mcm2 (Cdc46/Mcm family)